MFCNKCGAELINGSKFCHMCGNKIDSVDKVNEKKPHKKDKDKINKIYKTLNKEQHFEDNLVGDNEVSSMLLSEPKEPEFIRNKDLYPDNNRIDDFYPIVDSYGDNKKESKKLSKEDSTFKRFIAYMKEEEVYDKSMFDRSKPEIKYEEIDEASIKNVSEDSENLETQINERILVDDFEDENLNEDSLRIEIKSKNLETKEKDSIFINSTSDEVEDDFSKDSTNSSKDNKKPGIFHKLKGFLNEKDEDNLLELEPAKYKDLVYGQGDIDDDYEDTKDRYFEEVIDTEINPVVLNEDLDTNSNVNDFEEKPKKKGLFSPFKDSFKKKPTGDNSNIEDIDISKEEYENKDYYGDYSYADKGQTIRYSKTVIDSYLKKHKDGELTIEDIEKLNKDILFKEQPSSSLDSFTMTEKDLNKYLEKSFGTDFSKDQGILSPDKSKKTKVKKEKDPNKTSPTKDFFVSIKKFFVPTKDKKKDNNPDNLDIIFHSPVESSDTMPLVLSKEEREILNKELGRRQGLSKQEEVLIKSNDKVKPIIRKLISFGALLIIPLILISFGISLWTISWVEDNIVFVVILGLLKYLTLYVTIYAATNSAFNAIKLRLKKSVINLFIQLQMVIYLIIDTIYVRLTFIENQSIEALLHVFSPKIETILLLVFLGMLLLIANFNKIKERNGSFLFLGWYVVIAVTITLVVILLQLLLSTALLTFFSQVMFN